MLPKVHLTSHSRMSCSRLVTTPLWLSESLRPFLYNSVYSLYLFLLSSASVRSLSFCPLLCPSLNEMFLFNSVQSVVSNSLWPHGLQLARLPCPSSTPRAYTNPCPLSRWCHPTISSCHSLLPFSSCLQSLPASGSFLMHQFFTSGSQSIVVSASASILPVNIHDCYLSISIFFKRSLLLLLLLLLSRFSRVRLCATP